MAARLRSLPDPRGLILALVLVGCAPTSVQDWCLTSVTPWVEGGYGQSEGTSRTGPLRTRDDSEDWGTRGGVSWTYDTTGNCWEYDDPEEGAPGPTDPNPAGSPRR